MMNLLIRSAISAKKIGSFLGTGESFKAHSKHFLQENQPVSSLQLGMYFPILFETIFYTCKLLEQFTGKLKKLQIIFFLSTDLTV